MEINIRKGEKADIPAAFDLIQELAVFEKAPDEVENTVERMLEDGFGSHPLFGFFVAEAEQEIVGLALFYFRYSTWKGKVFYLEDLVVQEQWRGKGIGNRLLEECAREAHRSGCNHMLWQVLDWNQSAIDFYEKKGAELDAGWINCRLNKAELEKISRS